MGARGRHSVIRTTQLKILLSDLEKTWLENLANDRGFTVSDWVRQQIREAHEKFEKKEK